MTRSTIVTIAGFLVVAISLGYCHVRTVQLDEAFKKVKIGDVERDVVATMGHPHQIFEGCNFYGPSRIAGCAREYVYFPPWTIVGEAWSISLNADGAVVNTAHFVSP